MLGGGGKDRCRFVFHTKSFVYFFIKAIVQGVVYTCRFNFVKLVDSSLIFVDTLARDDFVDPGAVQGGVAPFGLGPRPPVLRAHRGWG